MFAATSSVVANRKRKKCSCIQSPEATTKRSRRDLGFSPNGTTTFSSNQGKKIAKVLRSIVGDSCPIFYFPEYAKRRCPSLSLDRLWDLCRRGNEAAHTESEPNEDKATYQRLARTIIIPLAPSLITKVQHSAASLPPSIASTTPTSPASCRMPPEVGHLLNRYKASTNRTSPITLRRELLSSLVDGVIGSLVHRREQIRRGRTSYQNDGRNVLSSGYILGSTGSTSCPRMAPGVHCTHPNSCVLELKESPLSHVMHQLLGDDILRELMQFTVVLFPVSGFGNNYYQVCGPPLTSFHPYKESQQSLARGFRIFSCDAIVARDDAKTELRGACSIRGNEDDVGEKQSKTGLLSTNTTTPVVGQRIKISNTTWNPNAPLPRYKLFYSESFVKKIGFPPSHTLNQTDDSRSVAKGKKPDEALLNNMFQLYTNGAKKRKRWKRLRMRGIEMCQLIRKNHQNNCDYARLLERYCPMPLKQTGHLKQKGVNLRTSEPGIIDPLASNPLLPYLVTQHTSPEKVVSFLKAVLKHLFPPEFWGSEHNFRVVLQTMTIFVNLRRRELFPEKAIVHGLRVNDILWISNDVKKGGSGQLSRSDHDARTALVRNMMRWLYSQILIPLLGATFYITESDFAGNRVLYYRKPVWSKLRSLATDYLQKQQYKKLSAEQAIKQLEMQTMGCSRLRLLTKKTGVRAIATLSKKEFVGFRMHDHNKLNPVLCANHNFEGATPAKSNAKNLKQRTCTFPSRSNRLNLKRKSFWSSTNKILTPTYDILKYEQSTFPDLFGSGVFGFDEVHPLLCTFLERLQSKAADKDLSGHRKFEKRRPLYFASVDIHHCFDNIDQRYLHGLVSKMLSEDVYLIQNYTIVHPFDSMGRPHRKKMRKVGPPESFTNLPNLAVGLSKRYSESIVVDDVKCMVVKKKDILELLREHLFSHVVVANQCFGPIFLTQKNGIPQGSILSSILCNFYYGNLEHIFLDGVFDHSNAQMVSRATKAHIGEKKSLEHVHLLIRMVDDFLLITTDKETSVRFLTNMQTGIPELGVQINHAKTRVNHHVENGKSMDQSLHETTDSDVFFPWCGMLLNTATCEVRIDLSRFVGSQAVDALTVDRIGNEGLCLQRRMKSFVRPRCQPILFDSKINSHRGILINFYHVMALCAVKTAGYVLSGMERIGSKNPQFMVASIDDVIIYSYGLISSRLKLADAQPLHREPDFIFCVQSALLLGRHAFRSVFKKSEKDFSQVIRRLKPKRISSPMSSHHTLLKRIATMALQHFGLDRFHFC